MANRTFHQRQQFADAESIAIEALGFLAGDPERLTRFLALTGLEPDNVRDAARQPGFLTAVLDHVASDEALLIACAQAIGRKPEAVAAAQQALSPSGEMP